MDLLRYLLGTKYRLAVAMEARRIAHLRAAGLDLGTDVHFPSSTWIDEEYCHLISIGNSCGLSAQVMIFAHDPAFRLLTGEVRVASVTIHDSCHLGARTIVMPGVEIGPRTVVAARSVVTTDLPPDTFCAGDPARPFATLEQYLEGHRRRLAAAQSFPYDAYDVRALTPERRARLVAAVDAGETYIVGGRSAELSGRGGTPRTGGRAAPTGVAAASGDPAQSEH